MNERLEELKQLWNRNFEGGLTPAENARLSELMGDASLMEAFSETRAALAESEGAPMSDEAWKGVDAKIISAFRRQRLGRLLKPLALAFAASLALAGGAWWALSEPRGPRPALGLEGESF